jgi:6-phosphofructokinase
MEMAEFLRECGFIALEAASASEAVKALRTEIPRTVEPSLAKPYTGRDLLDRVRQALSKRSDGESPGT